MLDISIEAIEREFATAQANAGRQQEQTALARAQIIATLLAADIDADLDMYVSDDLTLKQSEIAGVLRAYMTSLDDAVREVRRLNQIIDSSTETLDTEDQLPPIPTGQPDVEVEDDDIDEDFFAEARKERER